MKRSVTIKAAWIGAAALIVTAVVAGIFSLYNKSGKEQSQSIISSGNIDGTISVLQDTGSVTINYNVPKTATKDAVDELEKKVNATYEKIELSRNEIALLAKALKDLDQRTSGIEKLPDGRTKLGHFVSGQPRIVIEEHDAAVKYFRQNDYEKALLHSKNAIKSYEETEKVQFSMSTGGLTNEGISTIYRLAALSAQKLHKNDLAYQYGKKALDAQSSAQNKALISTTLANLGRFREAIDYIDQALKENPKNADFQRLKEEYSQH